MAANTAQKVTIKFEATFPLPESQSQTPAQSPCSAKCGGNCTSCKTAGQSGNSTPLLEQAGDILVKLITRQYTPDQQEGALDVLDAILRRHYTRQ